MTPDWTIHELCQRIYRVEGVQGVTIHERLGGDPARVGIVVSLVPGYESWADAVCLRVRLAVEPNRPQCYVVEVSAEPSVADPYADLRVAVDGLKREVLTVTAPTLGRMTRALTRFLARGR